MEDETLATLGTCDLDDRCGLLQVVRRLLYAASFAHAAPDYHPLRDRLVDRAEWLLSVAPGWPTGAG
jgi:hypothetical protein